MEERDEVPSRCARGSLGWILKAIFSQEEDPMGVLSVRAHRGAPWCEGQNLVYSHEIPYLDIGWFLAFCVPVAGASHPLACWGWRGLGM